MTKCFKNSFFFGFSLVVDSALSFGGYADVRPSSRPDRSTAAATLHLKIDSNLDQRLASWPSPGG